MFYWRHLNRLICQSLRFVYKLFIRADVLASSVPEIGVLFGERMTRQEKGFSLIELLIVVAIILIIAAIAIPNLLRSRMAANEASAVGSVRTINTAEITYSTTWGIGFGTALSNLGGAVGCTASSTTSCLIDPVLSAGAKSGYTFAAVGNSSSGGQLNGYEVNGTPTAVGTTGTRSFCSDQSGVIRYKTAGTAIGTAVGSCAAVTTILQ
jgi:type IV pilus assembly protein PilA